MEVRLVDMFPFLNKIDFHDGDVEAFALEGLQLLLVSGFEGLLGEMLVFVAGVEDFRGFV